MTRKKICIQLYGTMTPDPDFGSAADVAHMNSVMRRIRDLIMVDRKRKPDLWENANLAHAMFLIEEVPEDPPLATNIVTTGDGVEP